MSVGIGQMRDGHGFRVVRHRSAKLRALRELDAHVQALGVRGIAVEVIDVSTPTVPLVRVVGLGAIPHDTSLDGWTCLQLWQGLSDEGFVAESDAHRMLAEQGRLRPLRVGAQLQNWDCDAREGLIAAGELEVGTLGLLGEDEAGGWLLSNNHVLAGQNLGRVGDRIAQPGGARLDADDVIATLARVVELRASPSGARPRLGNVVWNRVDAALARLSSGVAPRAEHLAHRTAAAQLGDEVYKVGRTTGLTRGRVVGVSERVGPVGYAIGDCWFKDSFTIESLDGQPFSDAGDSGATVARSDGTLLGLVYAGNGTLTHACPIDDVFEQLGV